MYMKTEKENFLGDSPMLCFLYVNHIAPACQSAKNAGLFSATEVEQQ